MLNEVLRLTQGDLTNVIKDDKAKKQDEFISNLYKQIEILKHEPKKIKRKRA